jgi:glycosyltransferase involved in cell wall biosynthesis
MINNKNLVTVITVSYNSEKYIEKTIRSVLNQTYREIQYIIIDGNSTDKTIEIIQKYEPLFGNKMIWISEKDNGIYDAMNKGLELVKDMDSYVIFLNSDDYFYSNNSIENVMKASHNEDFIYGKMQLFENNYSSIVGNEINSNILGTRNICYHPTVFAKKLLFEKVGYFSLEYKIGSDFDFFVKVFLNISITKFFSSVIVSAMQIGGISTTNMKKSLFEKLSIISKYYPKKLYIESLIYIKLYELPRNSLRLFLKKYRLIKIWRYIRDNLKKLFIYKK